jgi:uncharacterized protein YrrD
MATTSITIGAHVWSSDGKNTGRVTRFVVEPATRQLAALLIVRGPILTERVVDVGLVERLTKDGVVLAVSDAEAAHLPPYEKRAVEEWNTPSVLASTATGTYEAMSHSPRDTFESERVPERRAETFFAPHAETVVVGTIESVPESDVVVDGRTAIVGTDGFTLGHLHALTVDERYGVVGFEVTAGLVFKHHVRAPVSWVAEVTHDRIALNLRRDAALDAVEEADVRPA